MSKNKFALGQTVATRAVADAMVEFPPFSDFTQSALRAHASGDWGDTCPEDARENDEALVSGARLLSVWKLPRPVAGEEKVWIITEADRSVTTLLFPSDY